MSQSEADNAKTSLLQMGFDESLVDGAITATSSNDLTVLVDWIDKKQNGKEDDEVEIIKDIQPKSIKCGSCNKVFRDESLAAHHASVSGHTDFSESADEIKPLTEEEKTARLAELRQKMEEKKKARAQAESEENRRNEQIRRKQGKETQKVREELQKKELEKQALQRAKQKEEDRAAMNAVRARIKAQQRERAEKAAQQNGTSAPVASSAESAQSKSSSASPSQAYSTTTRIQIRHSHGPPLTLEFQQTDPLSAVQEQVLSRIPQLSGQLTFTAAFPRKVFGPESSSKSLKELDLVPSAALTVSQ